MITVASSLVVSNIFFSCFRGPIRKHVLLETVREALDWLRKHKLP